MDAINTLEQLDEQTASLTQQLFELEDTAPWDTAGQHNLRFQISQLERRYEGLKRRAPTSSSLEDFLPSPRKRQLLSDEQFARELQQQWESEEWPRTVRQDSVTKKDEELAWELYREEQASVPQVNNQQDQAQNRLLPDYQSQDQYVQLPQLPQPLIPVVMAEAPEANAWAQDDLLFSFENLPEFDEDEIRDILAEEVSGTSSFDFWNISQADQDRVYEFLEKYGYPQIPQVDGHQSAVISNSGVPFLLPVDGVTLQENLELFDDAQGTLENIYLPPIDLPEARQGLLLEDGRSLLNENRPLPIYNQRINQYIDYVRADPTKTVDEIKALLENIRPDMDIPPEDREGTPEALVYPLLEHQKLGLAWMKAMEEGSNKGGILADDMGLGKTIQAIALMISRSSPDPDCKTNLIIAPLSLLKQWEREIHKKLKPGPKEQLSVYIHHGNWKKHKTFKELSRYDVVLTTFGTLAAEYRRRVAEMERQKDNPQQLAEQESNFIFTGKGSSWYRIFIDEAQCIKNKDTLSARGCSQLAATYRFCLSGTPMQNRCEEIYSLIRFLRIKPYDDYTNFNRDFGIPFRSKSAHQIREAMPKFQALLKALLLRRTKTSQIDGKPILTLPPKVVETTHCVFSSEEEAFYSALRGKTIIQFNKYLRANTIGKNYSNILVLLLRLRQAACHPHLINDIEHKAGEVEEDTMIELAKGLSLATVTRLKEAGIEECPICMDTSNNPSIVLPCGHAFCTDCIIQVHGTAAQQNLRLRGDENERARCPGCRGELDLKNMIDWSTFRKVHMKEGGEEVTIKSGTITADALAKLRKDARSSAASKKEYISYLEENWMTSTKIEKCLELLEACWKKDETEKTIIFSQWTSMLDLLEVPIFRRGWKYRRYDGSMTSTERNDAIIEFTDDPEISIMLISMKAGNSGLNLVAASQIILFDPCYNPFIESQAIDRAYRIGQQKPVTVHKLCTQGTVENEILELQVEKMAMIGNALDETASRGIGRLSIKDLAFLFGYGEGDLRGMGIRN